jgi:hypothetical protein
MMNIDVINGGGTEKDAQIEVEQMVKHINLYETALSYWQMAHYLHIRVEELLKRLEQAINHAQRLNMHDSNSGFLENIERIFSTNERAIHLAEYILQAQTLEEARATAARFLDQEHESRV